MAGQEAHAEKQRRCMENLMRLREQPAAAGGGVSGGAGAAPPLHHPLPHHHQHAARTTAPSPFAHMQPLAEAQMALRREGLAVGLALQDCWFREVQVLPSRTHPVMQMNHGGGYLLSGTTVMPGGAQQQQG